MSDNPLIHSKLTQTILKINPGVERQSQATGLKLNKLIRKSMRSQELDRKQFRKVQLFDFLTFYDLHLCIFHPSLFLPISYLLLEMTSK